MYWDKNTKRWVVGSSQVRLGKNAGQIAQGINAIAIGNSAGQTGQGSYSIAIGGSTGTIGSQPANTVCILGTTGSFNFSAAGVYNEFATYIKPVRTIAWSASAVDGFTGPLQYNSTTGEIAYIVDPIP